MIDFGDEEKDRRTKTIIVDADGYEIVKEDKNYVSPYDLVKGGETEMPKFLEFAMGFNKVTKFLQSGFSKFANKEQTFLGRDSLGRPVILENGAATDNPRMKAIKKQYAPLIKEGNNIIAQANNDLRQVRDHLADLSGERVKDYEAISEMYGVLNSLQSSKIQAIKMNMAAIKDIATFEHKEIELERKDSGGNGGNSMGGNGDKYIDPLTMFNAVRHDPVGGRNMSNPNMVSEQVEYKPVANTTNTTGYVEPVSTGGINKGVVESEVSIFNISSESDIKKSEEEVESNIEIREEASSKQNDYDDFCLDIVDPTTSDPDVAINALKLRNGKKEVVRMTRDGSYYYLYTTDVNGQPVDRFINEQSIYFLRGVAENVDKENGITSTDWGEKYAVEFVEISDIPDFIIKQFKATAEA